MVISLKEPPMTFTPNQKIVVANGAPRHAGRVGYYEFEGENVIVIRLDAHKKEPVTLISIGKEHAIPAT